MKYRFLPFLMVLLFLSSCLGPDDPAEQRAVKAKKATGGIVIGAVAPWNTLDVMLWEGMEMAIDEINTAGGILDRQIRIIKRDDNGSMEKGAIIAQKFAENTDLVAVIGHYPVSDAMSVSVVYQYYGILLLSTVAADPRLTKEGFSLIFRMVPDDTVYGNKLAEFCMKQGYKRILVYQQIGTVGRNLADAFVIAAEEKHMAILDRQKYNSFTTREDFRKLLLRSKQRYEFDALVISGQVPQCLAFIDTVRGLGIDKPIIGGENLERTELLKMIASKTGKVFMPTTFNPNSTEKGIRRFVQAFKKRYGKVPDTPAAQAYDTIHTLAYAIKQAGSTAPPKMAEALHSTKGLKGLTGPVSFDTRGNRLGTNIAIKVIENGRFEYLPSRDSSPSGTPR